MQKHRFLVLKENINGSFFQIADREQVKKALKVLRLKSGESLELFDGHGTTFSARVTEINDQFIKGAILETNYVQATSLKKIALAQALPKGNKLADIVRMNTELGVDSFIFFESDYSITKIRDLSENKLDRLNKVAIEASRQSEREFLPDIKTAATLAEVLNSNYKTKLLLHSRSHAQTKSLKSLAETINSSTEILLIIGPEGGFSERELELAKQGSTSIILLNTPILRTETAGLVACSQLMAHIS